MKDKKVIVNIEIENTRLAKLGIDQPVEYRPLNFNSDHFVGYWINERAESTDKYIIFYVGTQTFNCKHCELNIRKLEALFIES